MKNELALEFLSLTKIYKEGLSLRLKPSVDNVSFSVPKGMIFGFLGANGAGKTTSIKIALGLQRATSGSVNIFGVPSENVSIRAKIGYLPERPYFQLNLKATEFLDYHRSLFGKYLNQNPKLSNSYLLELVGLADAKSKYLRSFSKGMLQRVGIAQALINDPDLLIFDEPMSGLDPVGRRDVRNLMIELKKMGKTVFFSTHILSDIESVCEQIAFLEKGKLKFLGGVDSLLQGDQIKYEIIAKFKSRPEAEMENKFEAIGDYYRTIVDGEEAAKKTALKCWEMGAEIKSFARVQKSLEEVLFGDMK